MVDLSISPCCHPNLAPPPIASKDQISRNEPWLRPPRLRLSWSRCHIPALLAARAGTLSEPCCALFGGHGTFAALHRSETARKTPLRESTSPRDWAAAVVPVAPGDAASPGGEAKRRSGIDASYIDNNHLRANAAAPARRFLALPAKPCCVGYATLSATFIQCSHWL